MSDTKNNTGNWNTGDRNTGHRNTGDRNAGDWNAGDWNAGDWNTGNWNTGDRNTGHRNAGDRNTGNWNTGNWNAGDWNAGDWNTGDRNTGNWNTVNEETGFFNTEQSDTVRVFNKPCKVEEWEAAKKPSFLHFDLTKWVDKEHMSDQEKIDNPTFHTTGGYLRSYEYKEAFQEAWAGATDEDREFVKKLPNFDADVFYEISGIRVDEPVGKEMTVAEIEAALGHKVKVVK